MASIRAISTLASTKPAAGTIHFLGRSGAGDTSIQTSTSAVTSICCSPPRPRPEQARRGQGRTGMTPERELLRVLADLTKGATITMSHVLAARALLAQPESPQQAVPAGCVECMQEASEVLSEERMPRGPLADKLWGFSLM